MEVRLLWEQKPLLKTVDDAAPCYAVVWSPDGARIFCGIGDRVYAFDRDTGTVGRTLKGPLTVSLAHSIHRHYADSVPGHKEVVYCLSCSSDGTLIASGGADKTVIIWTSKLEGLVKYTHQESIQCLAFNPVTQQLASGATTDLGMWHAKQRSVAKHTVTSKILSLAWTADGQYLALGHFNGRISIRDAEAREKVKTVFMHVMSADGSFNSWRSKEMLLRGHSHGPQEQMCPVRCSWSVAGTVFSHRTL